MLFSHSRSLIVRISVLWPRNDELVGLAFTHWGCLNGGALTSIVSERTNLRFGECWNVTVATVPAAQSARVSPLDRVGLFRGLHHDDSTCTCPIAVCTSGRHRLNSDYGSSRGSRSASRAPAQEPILRRCQKRHGRHQPTPRNGRRDPDSSRDRKSVV